MQPFTCNARYFLITYSQCGSLDPWAVNDHFASLGAECIIGREIHADEGVHLHAFVDFGRKFRSRRVRVFDVDGHHPNIKPSKRSPEGGYDYAIKDGEVVAGGLARPSVNGAVSNGDKWSEIVGSASESEFWEAIERLDPKALCTNYGNLRKFADWRYKPEPELYVHPPGLNFELGMVPELAAWGEFGFGDDTIGMSVVLLVLPVAYGVPPPRASALAYAPGDPPPWLEGADF